MTIRREKKFVQIKLISLIFMVMGVLSIFIASLSFADEQIAPSTERMVTENMIEISGYETGPDFTILNAKVFYPTPCHVPKDNIVHKTRDANNIYLFHFTVIDQKDVCPQVMEEHSTVFLLPKLKDGTYDIYAGNQKEVIGRIQIDNERVEVMPAY